MLIQTHRRIKIAVTAALLSLFCSIAVIGGTMLHDKQNRPGISSDKEVETFANVSSSVISDTDLILDPSDNQTQFSSSVVSDISSVISTENDSSVFQSTSTNTPVASNEKQSTISSVSSSTVQKPPQTDNNFFAAIWYAYYEIDSAGMNVQQYKSKIGKMFDGAVALGCNNVIVQVRPFADAFYYSKLFPTSAYIAGTQGADPGFDPLKCMIEAARKRNLKIHAWINPYRVANSSDLSKLADTNMAKIWLTDGETDNDSNAIVWGGKIYFNPAKSEVRKLIIDGIREILDNYDVDGIHLDDYFYPTAPAVDDSFDGADYQAYLNGSPQNRLSVGDWRRANVNALISGIYSAVKQHSGVVFGISPSAHISFNNNDDNYKYQYADIKLWMNSSGYIDYIAPQLYFGYSYKLPQYCYRYLLDLWTLIPRKSSVKIFIGLAAYKIGTVDRETTEWQTDTSILARQVTDALNSGCDGICIFDYSNMFSDSALNTAQREAIIPAINNAKSMYLQ